jgi:radical SAM superfamily enzyme YgiQ (UPF0313 family)
MIDTAATPGPSTPATAQLTVAVLDIDPRLPNITSQYLMPRHGVLEAGTAASRAGFDTSVFVETLNGIPFDRLEDFDIVGAAVTGSNLSRVEELFTRLRRVAPSIRLVAGGPHATLSPVEVARFVDVVVRDEGEQTFPDVLRAFATGGSLAPIAGISYLRDGRVVHNPRRAFQPSFGEVVDLSLLKGYRRSSFLADAVLRRRVACGYATTSRGCPFPCSFCYENMIGGTGFRRQPEALFVENVRRQRDFLGVRHFWLADSNFSTNPKHCREVVDAILEADLGCTFSALCRVEIGGRPELLADMRRAGFETLVLGMEATDDDKLLDLKKRQSVDEIRHAIRAVHDADMTVMGLFMIGFDDDTAHTADSIVDFCEENEVDYLSLYCLTEYPELPGRTLPRYRICETDLDYYTGHYVTTFPLTLPPSELERTVFAALERFYRPTKLWGALRRKKPIELLKHLALYSQMLEMSAVSRRHREKLRRVEAPYYGADGRLRIDRLQASPVVRHALRPDVLAGWADPEEKLVPLGRPGGRAVSTSAAP